jgi:hypothetical protein
MLLNLKKNNQLATKNKRLTADNKYALLQI